MKMVVCLCTVELYIPGIGSLKGKRQILRSIKDRIKNRMNVSIAEVDGQDLWQRAVLGMTCVGNETAHVQQVLQCAVELIRAVRSVEIVAHHMERV